MRGEFEIQINGQTRGFKFSTYTLAKVCEMQNCSLSEMYERMGWGSGDTEKVDIMSLINLFYAAAYTYCKSKNQIIDFEPVHVSDWMDEIGLVESMNMIKEAFKIPESKKALTPQQSGS